MLKDMKSINSVMLMAHCDDEFLFGWPVIKHFNKIIVCTDDKTHPTRQWCKRRSEAFAEIGKLFGVETVCLRHDSGFAKKEHKELVSFVGEVQEQIAGAEAIFTHNGWGEYGHLDHILLHQIVRMTGRAMLTTDICFQADWYKVRRYPQGEVIGAYVNDLQMHEQCMEIYKRYGAMGWSQPPVQQCDLIRIQ